MQRRLVLAPSLRLLWRQAQAALEVGAAAATTTRAKTSVGAGAGVSSARAHHGSSAVVARHAWGSAASGASGAASGAASPSAAAARAQRPSILPHRLCFSSNAAPAAAAAPASSLAPSPPPPQQQQQQPPASDGITLSDSAVARLLELQRRAGGRPVALRVEVEGGGCSGFQYVLRLEEGDAAAAPPAAGEAAFERGGARLLVDEVSLGMLKGAVVEFEDTLMRSAFHVASNPNSEASCGCGSSFAAKGL